MTPHQRLGRVDDIASTVAFLCSDGGSFINGQTIVVDGGWSSTKYLSDFALNSEWVAALNLFALLDQAAARFGDRGAVYPWAAPGLHWAELRDRALRLATSIRRSNAVRRADRHRQREPSGDRGTDVRRLGRRVRRRAHQLQAPSREMVQILDDAGAALVFASPKIAAGLTAVTDVPIEVIDVRWVRRAAVRRARRAPLTPTRRRWRGCSTPAEPPGRSKGAMLSHRNLMAMTVVPSRGFRCAGRELQPGPRRTDVARFRPLHRAIRAARRPPGDPRIGRVRPRRVPRPVRAPPGMQRVSGPDHGAAAGADGPRPVHTTCGRSSTAAARCTSTA